jgi:hypothetical protein
VNQRGTAHPLGHRHGSLPPRPLRRRAHHNLGAVCARVVLLGLRSALGDHDGARDGSGGCGTRHRRRVVPARVSRHAAPRRLVREAEDGVHSATQLERTGSLQVFRFEEGRRARGQLGVHPFRAQDRRAQHAPADADRSLKHCGGCRHAREDGNRLHDTEGGKVITAAQQELRHAPLPLLASQSALDTTHDPRVYYQPGQRAPIASDCLSIRLRLHVSVCAHAMHARKKGTGALGG